MFKRIDELINIHNLKHEIKEKDDSIWYIINGFKECPDDTISIAYCPKFTSDQKIAAFVIYDNEVKEGRMFDNITVLNEWFEAICNGDENYCYPNEEIHV